MLQKLMQKLAVLRLRALEENSRPIDGDVAYEAGRRIGVLQGMDRTHQAINAFIADADKKDGDL